MAPPGTTRTPCPAPRPGAHSRASSKLLSRTWAPVGRGVQVSLPREGHNLGVRVRQRALHHDRSQPFPAGRPPTVRPVSPCS